MAEEKNWSDEVFGEIRKREIASVCKLIPDGGSIRLSTDQGGQEHPPGSC